MGVSFSADTPVTGSECTVLHFCGNGAILKEQDVLLSTNGDGLHPVGQWVEGEATQC